MSDQPQADNNWTPVLTGAFQVGTGGLSIGAWRVIDGRTMLGWARWTLGTGFSIGDLHFELPQYWQSIIDWSGVPVGDASFHDEDGGLDSWVPGETRLVGDKVLAVAYTSVRGNNLYLNPISPGNPYSWSTGDSVSSTFEIPVAPLSVPAPTV